MNTTLCARATALALAMGCIASPALAQDHGPRHRGDQGPRAEQRGPFHGSDRQARRDDRRDDRRDARHDRRDNRYDHREDRRHEAHGRPFYSPHRPPPRVVYGHPHGWRGAGPNHNFYRGGRLPPGYRSHYYVVDNWRGHHLSAPPRGYHWVQTGPDYVLAAIATGVILQIVLGG